MKDCATEKTKKWLERITSYYSNRRRQRRARELRREVEKYFNFIAKHVGTEDSQRRLRAIDDKKEIISERAWISSLFTPRLYRWFVQTIGH